MIISRTPFRMSFFGGGTDYPVWYRRFGGSVLTTTINKYCYISCRHLPPFFDHKTRVAYSQVEAVQSNDDIAHRAVRGILKHMAINDGLEIHHDGDLPAKTGLGSSSSFTIGLLHTLYALKRKMITKEQLAREAIYIEQHVLKESVGCQDQVAAAFGGFNRIDFFPNDEFRVTPVVLDQKRINLLQSHILLYFTGFSRIASNIARDQIEKTAERVDELKQMYQMVDEAISILNGNGDIGDFGKLLHESWKLKRGLTDKISTPKVDEIYEAARSAGALGGKLLGAGGGGFIIFFVRPEDHPHVFQKLEKLLRVPVRFEQQGSQIIFYNPSNEDGDSFIA